MHLTKNEFSVLNLIDFFAFTHFLKVRLNFILLCPKWYAFFFVRLPDLFQILFMITNLPKSRWLDKNNVYTFVSPPDLLSHSIFHFDFSFLQIAKHIQNDSHHIDVSKSVCVFVSFLNFYDENDIGRFFGNRLFLLLVGLKTACKWRHASMYNSLYNVTICFENCW